MQNSGLLLDVKKVGEDLDHADRRSVEAWLSALVDTCLIVELPPYAKSARGRLRAHSKWYAVDHGLIQAFAISPDPRNDPELGGMVVEATVFRHLRSLAGAEVFHGRASADREGSGETEKDFVVIREGRRVVVEATLSKAPRTAKLDRLKQTAADLRAEAAVIVYGGIADETYRGVRLLPLHRFLARPEEGLRGAS
jgi:predicted AAA+ superfamily ATPase